MSLMKVLKPEDFLIGDIVQLKSGGPKMTVIEIELNFVKSKYWNIDKGTFEYDQSDFETLINFTAEKRD
jgi:uncharacterized protein YodC (DUF2158 family)